MRDLLADLNEPQRRAVCHVDGPLLVLAGAGSGKTRVITRRVAYLIAQGVPPRNVLAITFTNKAAEEMRNRVEALQAPPGATVCTFHALCARLLREFAPEAGVSENYSIYDRDDQLRAVKEAMGNLEVRLDNLPPARVLGAIGRAKNSLKSPDDLRADGEGKEAESAGRGFYDLRIARIYQEYQKVLAGNNALDFDDLLLRVAFLMRDRPDIRGLLGRRYAYILIDEYQDTNRAQYLLAHGLAMDHENICVTGDPDQSIYAWRGASIRNIMEFEADYPNAAVVRLEENYRSRAPILAAASRLIARNRMRKEKALWTRRAGGGDVLVVYLSDERAEAAEVARRILQRKASGGRMDEVAVFYRINALSRVVEAALRDAAIPYRIARGVEFYNRKEVRDVLAYLRVLANPADDLSCQRILNVPSRGIGATTVGRLTAAARQSGRSLPETCTRGEEAGLSRSIAAKTRAFAELIESMRSGLDRPVRDVVAGVLTDSGLEAALDAEGDEGQAARANVAELVSNAAEFDRDNPAGRLPDFLHQVSLVSDVDHFEGTTGAVSLMTLHAAKGLEFPAVFIVGCEMGLLPMVRLRDDDDLPSETQRERAAAAMEEERRLAFVGMTRAMEELTLTCARSRLIRGMPSPQMASPFLEEVGREGVSFQDLTAPPSTGRTPRRHRGGGFYDDVDDRAAIERLEAGSPHLRRGAASSSLDAPPPPPPPEYENLTVNCRVRHPKFGAGKVISLRNDWPETKAEVIFDDAGPKTIYLKHTRLEVIEEWG